MKTTTRNVCLGAAILGVVALALTRFTSQHQRRELGERAVARIEAFRQDHGRLPGSLSEMGVLEHESGPVYYQREEDGSYIVWYGLSVGESCTWSSTTRAWSTGG